MAEQTTLTIKLFLEDSFTPLHNVRIQLTPLDVKDSKKPQDEIQEGISQNGVLQFNLPSNTNTFELTILDTRYHKTAKGDKGARVTNNYANTPTPTITLHLISKPSLYFNGYELQIHQNNKIIQSFKAYSGNALSEQEKADLQNNKGYKKFIAYEYRDSAQNIIQYFCLDTEWQKQKDKGAIPEGIYYIDITQSKDNKQSGIREYNNAWYSFSRTKEGEKQWGKYNIPIYTNKDCTNTTEPSTKRQGFYIHGGESYGDNGGIDVAKEMDSFIASMQRLSNQSLVTNNAESKGSKIPIELLVEYTHILSSADIESIHLHREIQRANDHTIQRHRVVLTANYTKPDSMSEESFNAQKQQTYWAYKELSQTEEYNTDTILLSELQFFKRNNQKYRGEQIEINLIEHQWHNYDRQILVFAFSPKDITENERGEEMIENPKWRIITRGFRYDMLKRVFNGINYALLDTTPTTQAQRNQYNEVSAKVQKLKDMVDELNRLHTDNEPMFVHYRLDTRARIEHFFAQARAECGNTLVLEENLNFSINGLLTASGLKSYYNPTNDNQQYRRFGYATFELFKTARNKEAQLDGRNDNARPAQRANEQAIANKAYGTRLGNQGGDDGYNFRGRGLLHITGRGSIEQGRNEGYTGFNQRVTNPLYGGLQNRDFVNNANDRDSLANNGLEALLAGVYVWKTLISRETRTHLYDIANAQDSISPTPTGVANIPNLSNNLRLISQRINGGNNGLSNRQDSLNHIRTQRIFDDFE